MTGSGKPISQHEDAVGLAETMLLEFTVSFSGNSCPGSHHCGQQTIVTVPGPGFNHTHGYLNKSSQLFLLSRPTSYMGYSGCKINCIWSIFMLTCKSLAQWEALRMTVTCQTNTSIKIQHWSLRELQFLPLLWVSFEVSHLMRNKGLMSCRKITCHLGESYFVRFIYSLLVQTLN